MLLITTDNMSYTPKIEVDLHRTSTLQIRKRTKNTSLKSKGNANKSLKGQAHKTCNQHGNSQAFESRRNHGVF